MFTTLVILVAARRGLIPLPSSQVQSGADSLLASILPLLTWIYVLTAVGVALTSNRFVACTAE